MLKNVWNTSVIRRIGLEADAKDIIGVVASDMQVIGASLIMLEMQGRQFKLRDMLSSFDREAMELVAGFREAGKICDGSIAATERVWPAAGCCLGGPSRGGVTGAQHRRWVVQAGFIAGGECCWKKLIGAGWMMSAEQYVSQVLSRTGMAPAPSEGCECASASLLWLHSLMHDAQHPPTTPSLYRPSVPAAPTKSAV